MHFRLAAASLAAVLLLAGLPLPVLAQSPNEPVTLNFVNAEIEAVARTMAAITGRNIVVDPRVKGTINLATDRPVAPAAAFNQFVVTLRLSGYTVVESGGLLKVVPEAEAKLQGGAVSVGNPGSGSQIVTQIFRLNFENAGNLVPILRPLINPNNTINVNPGNNSLVITDYADNLQRLGRIIAALDVSNATDVEVINLQHALAPDLAPIVQRLIDSSGSGPAAPAAAGQGQTDTSFRTTILAEPRSNSLVVRAANAARMNLVRSLVQRLDQPGAQSANGNIHVVYLKNAEAVRLAAVLRAAMAAMPSTNPATGATQPGGAGAASGGGAAFTGGISATANTGASPATTPIQGAAQPSTGGQIQADPATNSLIITAPEPQYRQLRAVIDRLDARRAQVFVESLIAEVNADKAAEFGIQWQGPIGREGGRNIGLLGTNFSAGGTNIIDLALTAAGQGNTPPSQGLNFGVARRFGGVYVLGFLARFLQTNGDANILSTPNLLTLDNEEAKIVIGQNVPFVTGQYTNANSGTGGSVNPFQTIERKDVGLVLKVTPHVNEGDAVRMEIHQEVSSLAPPVSGAVDLVTNKRELSTSVLVADNALLVLGGLIDSNVSDSNSKVPGLGSIPILGNLFRYRSNKNEKRDLMVFLRPQILRDAATEAAVSSEKYNYMRTEQLRMRADPAPLTPRSQRPLLPEVRDFLRTPSLDGKPGGEPARRDAQ